MENNESGENMATGGNNATGAGKGGFENKLGDLGDLNEVKGMGAASFLRFDKMFFPIIARYLFIALCILLLLGGVAGLIGAIVSIFTTGILAGLFLMVAVVFYVAISLVFLRIWFELILVGFSINEAVQEIRKNTRK